MSSIQATAHKPHVMPLKMYFAVWGALMIGTGLTVAVSFVHLGFLNVPLMLAIATVKASLVALFFMHLWYDEKFNLVILAGTLIYVLIFFAFTLLDSLTRGRLDPEGRYEMAPTMDRPGAAIKPSEMPAFALEPLSTTGTAETIDGDQPVAHDLPSGETHEER